MKAQKRQSYQDGHFHKTRYNFSSLSPVDFLNKEEKTPKKNP